MYQNSFFPLRTMIGKAIQIKESGIRRIFESGESQRSNIEYDFSVKPSIAETRTDPRYARYLPTFDVDGTTILPGPGMDTLPLPPAQRPFNDSDQVTSFFARGSERATTDVSRRLSASFSLQLTQKALVGGICFGGFPYLNYSHGDTQGRSPANFGLPREVRLTCSGSTSEDEREDSASFEFLDSEIAATKQDIVSQSGFHFLCIDPTSTQFLTVHFSDFPLILSHIGFQVVTSPVRRYTTVEVVENYGFVIPYFYVFEYRESTRYRPTVLGGLLGAQSTSLALPRADSLQDAFATRIDDMFIVVREGEAEYFDFTAASAFGQQRTYFVNREHVHELPLRLKECFISFKVEPGRSVTLYIQQAEEYERCIAGLKMFLPFLPDDISEGTAGRIYEGLRSIFPDLPDFAANVDGAREELEEILRAFLEIPPDVDFCEKIGIRVYELDPLEGVPPPLIRLDSKYATLLAEKEIDELHEIALGLLLEGLRFVRPSNARFFAVELTNRDHKAGQFVVKAMRLQQSAHVSVHARAARTQLVRTLNFRVIGPDLAEDYSLLGKEGFNFSIERLVAGEQKGVLFRANSLLDLLHSGAAKIFSNVRRSGVEQEITDTIGGRAENFELRRSQVKGTGWRKSETGEDVEGKPEWSEYDDFFEDRRKPGPFENISNAEIRTHTELLSPQADVGEWESNAFIGNAMFGIRKSGILRTQKFFDEFQEQGFLNSQLLEDVLEIPRIWIPTYGDVRLFTGFSDVWKGIAGGNIDERTLRIEGIKAVTSSPFGINALTTEFFEFIRALRGANLEEIAVEAADFVPLMGLAYLTQGRVFALSTANSLSVGMSVAPAGLGFTFSASTSGGLLLPSYTYINSFGTQGSITKQASKAGYVSSQLLNDGFDESDSKSEVSTARSHRRMERREVEGTDRQRVKGAEVMWQGQLVDIISGAIPLNLNLPATAGKIHFRTSDDSLRVRFGSGVGKSISVDFWFDITEEIIRDDY